METKPITDLPEAARPVTNPTAGLFSLIQQTIDGTETAYAEVVPDPDLLDQMATELLTVCLPNQTDGQLIELKTRFRDYALLRAIDQPVVELTERQNTFPAHAFWWVVRIIRTEIEGRMLLRQKGGSDV